jgi:hypothetical protein
MNPHKINVALTNMLTRVLSKLEGTELDEIIQKDLQLSAWWAIRKGELEREKEANELLGTIQQSKKRLRELGYSI